MPNFSDPSHLPHRRPQGVAGEPDWLPRQRRGITPQMVGRYPDYDVLESADTWDEATRKVVLERLTTSPQLRFFDRDEALTLEAFVDTALAQTKQPRIPVLAMVDANLADGRGDGYQYAEMPSDGDTWRLLARGLNRAAAARHGDRQFSLLTPIEREALLHDLARGRLSPEDFEGRPPRRVWMVCMRIAVSAFYAHPWSWNEIGFAGPAYPRGYMRLGIGQVEPHEARAATDADPARLDRPLTS